MENGRLLNLSCYLLQSHVPHFQNNQRLIIFSCSFDILIECEKQFKLRVGSVLLIKLIINPKNIHWFENRVTFDWFDVIFIEVVWAFWLWITILLFKEVYNFTEVALESSIIILIEVIHEIVICEIAVKWLAIGINSWIILTL